MSKENVKLFYEALARDKALQAKFNALNQKKGTIYRKELIPLAKKAGFDFTEAELQDYARDAEKPAKHELSEDELAAVAGGTCDTYTGTNCPTLPGFAISCPSPGIICPNPGVIPGQ
jgi:predicted ribosomally synthesized peptide with nif11-like leader